MHAAIMYSNKFGWSNRYFSFQKYIFNKSLEVLFQKQWADLCNESFSDLSEIEFLISILSAD